METLMGASLSMRLVSFGHKVGDLSLPELCVTLVAYAKVFSLKLRIESKQEAIQDYADWKTLRGHGISTHYWG
jgi:hypothetical protein